MFVIRSRIRVCEQWQGERNREQTGVWAHVCFRDDASHVKNTCIEAQGDLRVVTR